MHHLKNLRTEVKNLEYSKQSWKNMGILDVWDCLETQWGFPRGSEGKESACNVRDPGLILESGRSLEEGNGNPLQYSCLENPIDRGAWWAIVNSVTKRWTWLKRLSTHKETQWMNWNNDLTYNQGISISGRLYVSTFLEVYIRLPRNTSLKCRDWKQRLSGVLYLSDIQNSKTQCYSMENKV